jgi:hypothetical protein
MYQIQYKSEYYHGLFYSTKLLAITTDEIYEV